MNRPPRRSTRSAAAIVFAALGICGALLGALWSWLAPPIHTVTALTRSGDRVDAFLGTESDNLFVSAAILIGLLAMLAIVSAVLVWQWRPHRGPVLVTALWLGQVAAGAAAAGVGAVLVHWRYGTPDHGGVPLSPENRVHYFTEAPPVFLGHGPFQIAVTLLFPAALAAVAYALMAVATPHDDLGAWPPEQSAYFWPTGAGPTGAGPTGAGREPVHPA